MNWEAIGAIAELVGGIGVIASLVYLATQIRQNTKWLRSTILESAGTRSSELARDAASDPSLSRLIGAAISGAAPMDPDERYRFELYLLSALRHYEISHAHFNDGLLDSNQFSGVRENLRVWLSYENFENWWLETSVFFNPVFQQLVNDLKEDPRRDWRAGSDKR
jgi:hypothetical protein